MKPGSNTERISTQNHKASKYIVQRAEKEVPLDGGWDGPVWGCVKPLKVDKYMGQKPEHIPETHAKLLYDDEYVHGIFRVDDKFVRVVAQGYHSNVWDDSCVEFFFTPGADVSKGYFNMEINAGGSMLFHWQRARHVDMVEIPVDVCRKIGIYHSLPGKLEPEVQEHMEWFIQFRLPINILENYMEVDRPGESAIWRANFYKCGNKTSHPHWLTWSLVHNAEPDFHLPEYFGTLEFAAS